MMDHEKVAQTEELIRDADRNAAARQHAKGKHTARERLEMLFDEGCFQEIDAYVTHRCVDFEMDKKKLPGDGVIGGYGKVNGRMVFAYAQDFSFLGGSMGEEQANKICHLIDMAMDCGAPIVGMNDSGGARIQEGVNSLTGYGKIFYMNTRASGVIPQITAILGPCAGGAVYSPALTDFVFVVEQTSRMFITGPEVIRSVTGESVSAEELGGAKTHSEISGNAHFCCRTEEECIAKIRELLTFLPSHWKKQLPRMAAIPEEEPLPELDAIVPDNPNRGYDMMRVIRGIADRQETLEYMASYAPNILTCFIRLQGVPVGVIANQPKAYAGCLDINASDKAARFIRTCDSFGLPLVTLTDVPGFLPGKNQEYGGIIRHGAKMLYAYSEATVPKITVILRKAYGGAYIAMCSRNLGCDMVFAWPSAQIAVMGEDGAARILMRGQHAPEEIEAWKSQYRDTFLNPYRAAERGQVDDIILPSETRAKLISALDALKNKPFHAVEKKHGNMPL